MSRRSRRDVLTGAGALASAVVLPACSGEAPASGSARGRTQCVAVEEHFWTPELRDARGGDDVPYGPDMRRKLDDLGARRIADMDALGIDLQILSLQEPGVQNYEGAEAVRLARSANDQLHRAVQAHPTRFAAFAALPTADPAAAVIELERAVSRLGFKGVMINGLTGGRFIDEPRFWPILEACESLGVPIFLHPATPHPDTIPIYHSNFGRGSEPDPRTNILARGGHGFTSEVQLSAMRLVMSDVFDRFPRLQFILGHLGEGLPFIMQRVDRSIRGATSGVQGDGFRIGERSLTERLRSNFYFAASGLFPHAALQLTIDAIGLERVLFGADYPFAWNGGAGFVEQAPIPDRAKQAILHDNAARLFRL